MSLEREVILLSERPRWRYLVAMIVIAALLGRELLAMSPAPAPAPIAIEPCR